MIKYEIYDEIDGVEEPEQIIRLALEPYGGGVAVVAVDRDGEMINAPYLVVFTSDGVVIRECGVNDALGFQLDDKDRIKERY